MGEAGNMTAPANAADPAEGARLLGEIADALDIPVSVFTRRRSIRSADEPSSTECSAMLAAFSRIRDPKTRAFCMQMLETFAQR